MSEHTTAIFSYLKGEDIPVDKEEFNFQFESHPDFPSLLSMSDALTFFNIHNGALRVEFSLLEQLPDRFLLTINSPSGGFLTFIERKGDSYYYLPDNSSKQELITQEKLKELWGGVVLLVEKDEEAQESSKPSRKWNIYILAILSLLMLGGIFWKSYFPIWHGPFYLLSFAGVLFSLGALKDLLNTKNAFLDTFCSVTTSTDCNAVVNSSKWKIFEKISFSDLSITFFVTEILALFLMGLSGDSAEYFSIQLILLLLSIPIILTSLYYQKFVEKKWCPICLSIATVLILELGYLIYHVDFDALRFNLLGGFKFFFVYSAVLLIWYPLKRVLEDRKDLREEQKKALRFKRNYANFKNNLIVEERFQMWEENPMVFGNPDASTVLDIVTSPFCGHCKDPHYMLEDLISKYGDQLKVRVNYSTNTEAEGNEKPKEVFRTLVHLRMEKGEKAFNEALDAMLQTKDRDAWLVKFKEAYDLAKVDAVLMTQYHWGRKNNFNFTPKLLINGYGYPQGYDLLDLPFFIGELMEDKTYQ